MAVSQQQQKNRKSYNPLTVRESVGKVGAVAVRAQRSVGVPFGGRGACRDQSIRYARPPFAFGRRLRNDINLGDARTCPGRHGSNR